MGEQEIDVDVSDEFDEENSSQISQTVSNVMSKKHYGDDNSRGGKNSESGPGRKKNSSRQVTQQSQKSEQLSDREMRKFNQRIVFLDKQGQSDKGRKKGVKQQQGNKTPRSDSSVETEQNPKSTKEGSIIQTNSVNSQNSSAGKQNGQSQPLSIFQQSQKQQPHQNMGNQIQLKKSQSENKSMNRHDDQAFGRTSGLERLVNVTQNTKSSSSDLLSGKMLNNLNNYQNGSQSISQNLQNTSQNMYLNMQNIPIIMQNQQNGSYQLQQSYQMSQQQQFSSNKVKLNYPNSLSSTNNKDIHVIVTEDDSEISASCDNYEDNKTGQSQNINNISNNFNNNASNNNLIIGGNDQVNNMFGGPSQGRKKKAQQRKSKENSQMTPQPNLTEQNSSSIQVISTEGKQQIKQGVNRINQNIISQNIQNNNNSNINNNNNSSAAIVSIMPQKLSSQSISLPQQESQCMNQFAKQQPQQENCPKTILLQNSINNNVIQLKRKTIEDITLINTSIPLSQQNSQQNLEDQQTRQAEQQQQQVGSSTSIQQQNQGNIQQTNKSQGNINGNYHNQQQYHHQLVNPSALPHALHSTHNMINIPSQTNQQNINSSNNININNSSINNNNSEVNTRNISNDSNNSMNNGNIKQSEALINSQSIISNETKKKKKRKNLLKEETHINQQQQIIGQYQQQQEDTQINDKEQKKNTILSEYRSDLHVNQQINTINSPQGNKIEEQQQNKTLQQQQKQTSPVKKNNSYVDNYNNNNSINGSFNMGRKQILQNYEEEDQEQENEFFKKEPPKIGIPVPSSLGIQTQHQLLKEQSNSKQMNQIKSTKSNRKGDFEYIQRLKKGPLNLNTFEDQPTLFLKLSDYQEQQKKEKDEVIEKHFEELIESTHSLNGSASIQQMNTTNMFQLSTFGAAFNAQNQTSQTNKPLLAFKQNKQELERQDILSQDYDSQLNGVNKTPALSSSYANNTQQKSRIRKLDNSGILDKTVIVQDKIIKKFKNSHYPENFKEVFSPLHSDFSATYLDPTYCSKLVSFFNRQQEFNKIIDKEDEEIDY